MLACSYVCQLRAMCTLHVKSHPQILMTYTYAIHMPTQLQPHTQTKVKLGTKREATTSIMVPENSTYKHFYCHTPSGSTEAGTSNHNSGLLSLYTLHMDV